MIKQEFKRLLKSKTTLIVFVLVIISMISYFFSYSEKQMFIEQFNNDFSPDLNREALADYISRYTGIKFLFDYWFNSDFTQISTIILYIWSGVFLSSNIFSQKQNGWGNFLVIRKNYKYVSVNILTAQSLYIFTVVFFTTVFQFILALIWGGFNISSASIGVYKINTIQIISIIILQIIIHSFYVILANGISSMCCTIIKNQYIIQALPLLLFGILPMLLAATLGNISSLFANVIIYFEPYNISMIISNVFQSKFEIIEIIYNILPIVFYTIVFFSFVKFDIKKNLRGYL